MHQRCSCLVIVAKSEQKTSSCTLSPTMGASVVWTSSLSRKSEPDVWLKAPMRLLDDVKGLANALQHDMLAAGIFGIEDVEKVAAVTARKHMRRLTATDLTSWAT